MLTDSEHSAFSNAIESGNIDAAKTLIQKYPQLVNHRDWNPPPLHCAILWDQPKVAELLLDSGADIEMLDPDRQTTPLRYAIMYCKTNLIPLLLSRGANTGPIVENGTSAIQLAKNALDGEFEDFDDLPRNHEYANVLEILHNLGLNT